jgi:sterol desaturase/sphingolipid hydroxylase (fatty acid hydroxylase superfamily)
MGETPIWVFALMGTCVLIEMVCSGWAGKKIYQANETFVNIACGILERLLDLVVFIALFGIFKYIHQSGFVLFHLPRPLPGYLYLPLLLAADFCWYWYHRSSHRINFLWGLHIVHHQSEDYNLSIFFRATGLQSIVRIFFWLPLPLLGFAPLDCLLGIGTLAVWQFFMHTQWIPRIPWLENWIATPSHHRVHHSSNPEYIDKNYAAFFTFYDRLFGSYAIEEAAPQYGVTHGYKRTNIVGVYFDYFRDLFRVLQREPDPKRRWELLAGPPEKMPLEGKQPHLAPFRHSSVNLLLLTLTLLVNAALLFLILTKSLPGLPLRLTVIAFMTASIIATGWYLEKK